MSAEASVKIYINSFAALLILTGLTVLAAFLDFGNFNTIIAMTIAVIKATIVVLYFMHLKDSFSLAKITFAAGLIWLALLLVGIFPDYMTRNRPNSPTDRSWIQKDASHYLIVRRSKELQVPAHNTSEKAH